MSVISHFIIGALFLSFFSLALAGEEQTVQVPKDKSQVEFRQPPVSKLNDYLNDPDYLYDRVPPPPETLWQKFMRWLSNLFLKAFRFKGSTAFFKVLMYIFITAAVVGAVLLILKTGVTGLFTGKNATTDRLDYEVTEEDIHGVDFDKLIAACIERKDYRKAVRLWYLKVLKELTDKEMIEWKGNKTNYDYHKDLQGTNFHQAFGDVSFLYEYAWYGNFGISKSMFESISGKFRSFSKHINRQDV